MKSTLLFSLLFFLFSISYTDAQVSKFVKNVSKSVQNDLFGSKGSSSTQPEPSCACKDAVQVLDLGGKLKIDYSEAEITTGDDGSILVQDRMTSKYYVVKDGVTKGPYEKGNPILASFGISDSESKENVLLIQYKEYISKSDDKFLITFMGTKYGPYARIDAFAVNRSKDKFAASVVENMIASEDQLKKMEAAVKKAKTDEEKMNLSMEYAQMVQSNMAGKDPMSLSPRIITNIPGVNIDPIKTMGSTFSANLKYDDILLYSYDKIMDMKGNVILTLTPGTIDPKALYIKSDNSDYASYSYGTLTFKNKSTLAELFNPQWLKSDGKVYLSYMYFSPKKNSLMQCKIPF